MAVNSRPELKELYQKIRATVQETSGMPQTLFDEELQFWRDYSLKYRKDDHFFRKIVEVTFHSGFKSSTASGKMESILSELGNYELVKDFSFDNVEEVIHKEGIIGNFSKVCATVLNAREFYRIIKESGSFKRYLEKNGFRKDKWDSAMDTLAANLSKRFYYLGPITVYHFLMDIGAFVIKPDRQIMTLLDRLNIVDSTKNDAERTAVQICRRMAKEADENIRVVDIILVNMGSGSEFDLKKPICPNRCKQCQVNQWCKEWKVQ